MRFLKQSTVVKEFKKKGWTVLPNREDVVLMSPDGIAGPRIFADVGQNGYTVLTDARWFKRGNVHIVSYWGPFQNMKHLEEDLQDIERIYTELCHTRFK